MEKEHNLEFYHCLGEHSVADMVTRQTSTVSDVLSERWTQGGFLKKDFDGWPINKKIKLPEDLPGLRVLPSPIYECTATAGKWTAAAVEGYFKHQEVQKFTYYFSHIN